jgi:putative FmdB family regulatory protein
MPLYNYECTKCDSWFSLLSSYEERKKWSKCKVCGARANYTILGQQILGLVKDPAVPKTLSKSDAEKMAKEGQESLVTDTQEALKAESGTSPYAKMTLSQEGVKQLQKEGVARKMTDAEKRSADEGRAAVVRSAAENMSDAQKKAITKRAGTKQDSL